MVELLADRKEAAIVRPLSDLAHLIAPIDIPTFEREYWEKKSLLIQRNDPDYYSQLLTLQDVDRILSLSSVRSDGLRVVLDGKETPISDLVSGGEIGGTNALERLYEKYRSGSTVVLNSLQQRWEPLQRLTQALGAQVSARFAVNVYVTPAGNQGFAPHYDIHDVFIAQVHGSKRWRLHGAQEQLPLKDNPFDRSQSVRDDPDQEFDLNRGDLLYLPRGTVHSAMANDTVSVHLTIGVHPVVWATVLEEAIKEVFAAEVAFRRGLPMGFLASSAMQREVEARFAELTGLLSSRLSASEMRSAAVKRAASISHPTLSGHLLDLEKLGEITVATEVRLRRGVRFSHSRTESGVQLDFHNKTVQLPARVTDEVEFILGTTGEFFAGNDIPGNLDESGRVVLIRVLVREGLLSLV
ncbi:cupin domain-containing protein [Actinomadura gamaensis]|uniref:Cupin domain-containing protein n=1 Tax=Actinomadura gamaensis TaxID=1763541 RepID=A0ABV9U946_9ACTN